MSLVIFLPRRAARALVFTNRVTEVVTPMSLDTVYMRIITPDDATTPVLHARVAAAPLIIVTPRRAEEFRALLTHDLAPPLRHAIWFDLRYCAARRSLQYEGEGIGGRRYVAAAAYKHRYQHLLSPRHAAVAVVMLTYHTLIAGDARHFDISFRYDCFICR